MARKQDYASGSGPLFSGKTPGSRGVANVPNGVGGRSVSGRQKAHRDVGWPGVRDSTLDPDDHIQSAK